MSRKDADAYLQQVVWREQAVVQRLVPGVDGPRLAALVDFTFNMGGKAFEQSTLRKRVLVGDWPGACAELRRWVHGGGKVLPGLVTRREREIALIQGTL
jgi:lysozyme